MFQSSWVEVVVGSRGGRIGVGEKRECAVRRRRSKEPFMGPRKFVESWNRCWTVLTRPLRCSGATRGTAEEPNMGPQRLVACVGTVRWPPPWPWLSAARRHGKHAERQDNRILYHGIRKTINSTGENLGSKIAYLLTVSQFCLSVEKHLQIINKNLPLK